MSYAKDNPKNLSSNIPMGTQKGKDMANFYSNNFFLTSPIRSNVTSVATPVIAPDAGTYATSVEVSITCATLGALIYYTTDGSTPTELSTPYTAPFTLTSDATVKAIAVYAGAVFSSVASSAYVITHFIVATGGTITTDGDYKVHRFTSSGTFEVTAGSGDVWYLVAAGGGGAGRSQTGNGGNGGGGAGGYRSNDAYDYAVTVGSYSVVVGAKGLGATTNNTQGGDGSASSFDVISCTGGGGGGGPFTGAGRNGGSGGASAQAGSVGGTGVSGEGNAGGISAGNKNAAPGGGGADKVGQSCTVLNIAGDGGAGIQSSITGSAQYYCAGGGGGNYTGGTGGIGGSGVGGNGAQGTGDIAGGVGTRPGCGGGGGQGAGNGGDGTDGEVIIRYKYQ